MSFYVYTTDPAGKEHYLKNASKAGALKQAQELKVLGWSIRRVFEYVHNDFTEEFNDL